MKYIDSKEFFLHCDAGSAGLFVAHPDRLSLTVSQRILREGTEQMWDCLLVLCNREVDGTLRTRVLLCNPDWDEPLEIANIQSRPERNPEFVSKTDQENGKA